MAQTKRLKKICVYLCNYLEKNWILRKEKCIIPIFKKPRFKNVEKIYRGAEKDFICKNLTEGY